MGLVGYVLNLGSSGVRIVVEGERNRIEHLVSEIKSHPPSVSRVNSIHIDWEEPRDGFSDFSIEKSSTARTDSSALEIPPDIGICNECIGDLMNPNSRWYLYPFTSCSACGPRFSTIVDLPYDRPNTTMGDFPLCTKCRAGYLEPLDRRYHAQTTACQSCGPAYRLVNSHGKDDGEDNPIATASNLLTRGEIVAIQGISGTHLVTKTTNAEPLQELRRRKRRSQRPFAIMVRDLRTLSALFTVSDEEAELLSSWRKPVVLVRKPAEPLVVTTASETTVSGVIPAEVLEAVSPGLDTVGVMLPYSPLHYLLFHYLDEPAVVMTSANPTGVPMYIDPDTIISELAEVADEFLVHNRRIHQRADDSVVKFVANTPVFIRRGRGYVPEPLEMGDQLTTAQVVALGPEEKNTGALLKSHKIYMTQHIGDTDRAENIQFLWDSLKHLMHLAGIARPDTIACDLHPEFLTTDLGKDMATEYEVPLIQVQHHHAHMASLIVDRQLSTESPITCITADGYGYAPDGTAWGGEVLTGDLRAARKYGGLKAQRYTGGNLSARYAVRALMGIMGTSVEYSQIADMTSGANVAPDVTVSSESLSMLMEAHDKGLNVVVSTSAGRYLDAVAAALGVCYENTYDGECPMKLEAVSRETDLKINPEYDSGNGSLELDTTTSLDQVLQMRRKRIPVPEIAYAAQWHLGEALAEIACMVSKSEGVKAVGLSGGVAVNRIITKAVLTRIRQEKLQPLIHTNVPPGDGGVSVGQAAVAAWKSVH